MTISVALLCRVLDVHTSGFYAWFQQPHSQLHQEVALRLKGQIKQFWQESGYVNDYRRIDLDLGIAGSQRRGQYSVADRL